MNRFVLPLAGFFLIALVLYFGVQNSPTRTTLASALIGKPAPQFELPNLLDASSTVSTRDLQGKPWVLNVWATWCVACRVEHQALMEIAQAEDVPIVGLNWRDETDLAHEWLNRLGNPYDMIAVDKAGRTAIDYGVYGAPETFLVDAQGIVRYRLAGPMTHEIWQREFMSRIQGRSAEAP